MTPVGSLGGHFEAVEEVAEPSQQRRRGRPVGAGPRGGGRWPPLWREPSAELTPVPRLEDDQRQKAPLRASLLLPALWMGGSPRCFIRRRRRRRRRAPRRQSSIVFLQLRRHLLEDGPVG